SASSPKSPVPPRGLSRLPGVPDPGGEVLATICALPASLRRNLSEKPIAAPIVRVRPSQHFSFPSPPEHCRFWLAGLSNRTQSDCCTANPRHRLRCVPFY